MGNSVQGVCLARGHMTNMCVCVCVCVCVRVCVYMCMWVYVSHPHLNPHPTQLYSHQARSLKTGRVTLRNHWEDMSCCLLWLLIKKTSFKSLIDLPFLRNLL